MYKKERGSDTNMQIKGDLRGEKPASRQSINEVSVEGGRYDDAEKQNYISQR